MLEVHRVRIVAWCAALLTLTACSNGRGSLDQAGQEQQAPAQVTVGGTVSGLAGGGLVLQNNNGSDLSVGSNGAFTFTPAVDAGSQYNVTVRTQPANPTQTCTIANATGTATTTNVTNIAVTCGSGGTFSVGGTVSGLAGRGLVLRNNGTDDLPIASNGSFTFAGELANGSAYEVSVATQPTGPAQMCTVADASGTVSGSNVRNITVTCASSGRSISGVVSGVLGSGLVLQNNGGDDVGVESSGGFTFPTALASGSGYNVTVRSQPSNPTQACTVQNGAGTVGDVDVINVVVLCSTREFTIGGTVSGLVGSGLVLQNNGADALAVSANGTFSFPAAVLSGRPYAVTIATDPRRPRQSCTIANGSGTVGASNVTNVTVNCATIGFTVGGSVSGLAGSGLTLANNSNDVLPIAASGTFTFPETLLEGSPYEVRITGQPAAPTQVCTVSNGSGAINAANVTDVAVSCVTSTFTVGGRISGLRGFGLSLQLNGSGRLPISSNGSFSFPGSVPSGSAYEVTIATQPFFPAQRCTISNGTGTVGAENVRDILVSC